ncbi:MAG: hypothetical protein QMD92_05435 [bacterium]|nr:hypothetical protein [bacterium]
MIEQRSISINLEQVEVDNLLILVEDKDKEEALNFCKNLKKKIEKIRSSTRSIYQRGGHIGTAKLE